MTEIDDSTMASPIEQDEDNDESETIELSSDPNVSQELRLL